MTADAIKLLCRAWTAALAKEYAKKYDVECTSEEDEMVFINMIFILETTCTVSYDTTCYIEKIVNTTGKPTEFEGSTTTTCAVTIEDTTSAISCSSPPTITIS